MTDTPVAEKTGAKLAQERQRQNLTVGEVAAKLRISPKQIEALEADEYDKLPGLTFVRGFMRNYARLLGLDAEALIQASGIGMANPNIQVPSIDVPSHSVPVALEGRRSGSGAGKMIAGLVLLAAIAVGAFWAWQQPKTGEPSSSDQAQSSDEDQSSISIAVPLPGAGSTPTVDASSAQAGASTANAPGSATASQAASTASSTTVETAAAQTTTAPAGGALGVLRLEFSGDAWVELRDRSDFVIHKEPSRAGDILEIQVRPPVGVVIGNAANVKLQFNGRAIDLAPHTKVSVARFTLNEGE